MSGFNTTSYAGDPHNSFIDDFNMNFEMVLQQIGSPIWDSFMNDAVAGDKGYFDRIESTGEANEKTSRNEKHIVDTNSYSRRILTWKRIYKAIKIDTEDIKRMAKDPTSVTLRNLAASLARKREEYAVNAFFSNVTVTQDDNDVVVSLPASQTIAQNYTRAGGGSNTNLNPEKLLFACEKLEKDYIGIEGGMDMGTKYVAMDPSQYYAMCTHPDVKTIDSFDSKPITDAIINGVAGFKFIKSNCLLTDGSGYRRVPVWVSGAMAKTEKDGIFTRINEIDDEHFDTQLYTRQDVGAKRIREEGVIEILCDETAAA